MSTASREGSRWLPRSMASRLYLLLAGGLLIAHGLSFGMLFYERYESATSMLMTNLEQDVVVAVNLLDHLPPEERAHWLPMLRRRTFHYTLDPAQEGTPLPNESTREMAGMIANALGPRYPTRARLVSRDPERFQVQVRLSDGSPLVIEVQPSVMPLAKWLPYVLATQLALLLLCAWAAVRLATRPLARLANAAETLRPGGDGARLPTGGPTEVAQAVGAFNAMQDRIARYMKERLQILASISHDLQTPITRLRLRAEAMGESPEREKIIDDLDQMQHLVREGIAYARSAHGDAEAPARVDLDAFLDSLVCDYLDTGRNVSFSGRVGMPVVTRPQALRRVVVNLVDNALKYAGAAEVEVSGSDDGAVIHVRDRGPGIPEAELSKVLEPFYRLEASRNRDTGGTGLGLAIATQLADAIGATLTLRNRDGGGLEAIVRLPRA
ncbi:MULTISPECIES: HAMP domain-containing sensor histidine kinase [unclassified Lysobacter]|uniref:sensor histidine kinase n=1 Tax=unclassified Lysobacter TaxID=2635362 RepID=UPI001C24D005|nr:HAMP domain-containing sensor histidine kinase [Lysobacter sp. MMG2]MBU8977852.1 HAMP domain-containing histidine kinase [Lysobacter sp. MMG2]